MGLGFGLSLGVCATVWNPGQITSLSNLKQWLRADLGVTTGSTLTWADQSPNGNNVTQSTLAKQPTHGATGPNSQAAFAFVSASTQFLSRSTAVLGASPWTIWLVHKITGSSQLSYYVGNSSSDGFGALKGTNRDMSYTGVATLQDSTATANWEIWEISNTGSATTLRVNGSSASLTNSASQPLSPSAQTTVGAGNNAGASAMDGGVAEIIACNSATLPASDVANIRTYLTYRYGLAA
jgi:hypothetical protein